VDSPSTFRSAEDPLAMDILDPKALRYFVTVARIGSISGAAASVTLLISMNSVAYCADRRLSDSKRLSAAVGAKRWAASALTIRPAESRRSVSAKISHQHWHILRTALGASLTSSPGRRITGTS
jgi:hypothetical protein